jgi:hypothetical protein
MVKVGLHQVGLHQLSKMGHTDLLVTARYRDLPDAADRDQWSRMFTRKRLPLRLRSSRHRGLVFVTGQNDNLEYLPIRPVMGRKPFG